MNICIDRQGSAVMICTIQGKGVSFVVGLHVPTVGLSEGAV